MTDVFRLLVCGTEYLNNTVENKVSIAQVRPIAGNYEASHGRGLDPVYSRLRGSASHSDAERDGIRIELHGGKYPDTRKGTYQKAIIEFECDPERTGLEGLKDEKEERKLVRREEKKDDEDGDDDDDEEDGKSSLKFISYRSEGEGKDEMEVLRLYWRTKYACEAAPGDKDSDKNKDGKSGDGEKEGHDKARKAGWGWFTWLIIM